MVVATSLVPVFGHRINLLDAFGVAWFIVSSRAALCPPLGCNMRDPDVISAGRSLWYLQERVWQVSTRTHSSAGPALDALRRLICVFRFSKCYGQTRHREAVQELVESIVTALEGVGMAQATEWSLAICQKPVKIADALDLIAAVAADAVAIESPRENFVVDALTKGPIAEFQSLSKWVLNLGAGPNKHDVLQCEEDTANCLVFGRGWNGVLFEGDPSRIQSLRKASQGRPGIILVQGFATPEQIAHPAIEHVVSEDFRSRHQRAASAGGLFPDFLKVDVDNGDCDFLEAAMSTFKPMFVEVEVCQLLIPPPIKYRHRFIKAALNHTQLYAVPVEDVYSRGCSLGMAASLMPDYELVQLVCEADMHQAIFAHRQIVRDAPLQALEPRRAWEDCMQVRWDRLMLGRMAYSMFSFDLDFFHAQSVPDQYAMLREHFEKYSSSTDWELLI